jgi:hypothetical protein
MKLLLFFVLAALTASVRADAPTYGTIRVTSSEANIYSGASANSKIEDVAKEGDEFILRGDKTYNGFYKIQYGKHISFISADEVEEQSSEENTTPTVVPTKIVTLKTPSPVLTPASKRLTPVTKLSPTAEVIVRPKLIPTWVGHKATAVPTVIPTESFEEATQVPSPVPQRSPGARPTQATNRQPWVSPTVAPSPIPVYQEPETTYAVPTRIPRSAATAIPTIAPYNAPTNTPTPVAVRTGHGHRIENQQTQQSYTRRDYGYNRQSTYSTGSTVKLSPAMTGSRDPWAMPKLVFDIPLGAGICWACMPAFKPDANSSDERCIDANGFAGLGIEGRPFSFWRFSLDWTAFSHHTKAADQLTPAYGVNLPGVTTIIFSDSDVQYYMDTNALRLGTKFSVPLPYIEPWVGGHIGLFFWKAEYRDINHTMTYGDDSGTAFGLDAAGGVDFKFSTGRILWIITPFYEYGGPIVFPVVKDIADTGVDWHDVKGTPAVIPSRFGIAFGIGF